MIIIILALVIYLLPNNKVQNGKRFLCNRQCVQAKNTGVVSTKMNYTDSVCILRKTYFDKELF